ncbi:MAG: hypothetical protein HYZ48_00035, partial [Chlamydiales bacterium]|nr:hypothetical protein [Chlamydiales bacterium]
MVEDQLPIGRIAFARSICIDWLANHTKMVMISLISILLLFFTVLQMTRSFSSGSDFAKAQSAYSSWVALESPDKKIFSQLEKPLSSSAEVQAKFGALVAQKFLTLKDAKNAENFMKQSWKRTQNLLSPYYAAFSKTSLLIARGDLKKALELSKDLKTQMTKDTSFWDHQDKMIRSGSLLYAYNLIRIATLEKEIGSIEAEMLVWEEFLCNAGLATGSPSKMADPEAYSTLIRTMQDKNLSLYDYIAERREETEKSGG